MNKYHRIIVIVVILLLVPMVVMAQDAEPVRFVEGTGTFDMFLNNILNDIQAFLLLTVAPATGLIVVGRNIGKRLLKRFVPDKNVSSEWVQFGIIAILFPLYHFANAADATPQLQTVVDLLTQLGSLLFVGGTASIASSLAFNVTRKHDNTVFGYQRTVPPQLANG